jgi:hypothetical protein
VSFLNTPSTPAPAPVTPGERTVTLSVVVDGHLRFFHVLYVDETSVSLLVRPDLDTVDMFPTGAAVGVILQQQPSPFMYMCTSTGAVSAEGVLELTRGRVC